MSAFHPNEQMLADFIQDKLAPEQEQRVELWLMDHADVIDELKLDLSFRNARRLSNDTDQDLKKSSVTLGRRSKLGWPIALAASFVIGILVAHLNFKQNLVLDTNISILTLTEVRSVGNSIKALPLLRTGGSSQIAVLRLQLDDPKMTDYRVEMLRQDIRIVAMEPLIPLGDGDLQLALAPSLLSPGPYTVIVFRKSEGDYQKIAELGFAVEK